MDEGVPTKRVQLFGCGHGHYVVAWESNENRVDLTGYFCPVCMGAIIGHGELIDLRILAPVQDDMPGW